MLLQQPLGLLLLKLNIFPKIYVCVNLVCNDYINSLSTSLLFFKGGFSDIFEDQLFVFTRAGQYFRESIQVELCTNMLAKYEHWPA